MYGLTYEFNVDRGELTALKQDVLAVGSVAVGYLTIETSLAEGQIMEVTFGKFNANKFTVITPALGFECVNIEPETWQMPMPDILFAEDGEYAFSLAVKSPVIKSDGTTDYTVLTTTEAGFTVNKSGAVVAHNPLTPTEVDAINAEIANISKRLSTVESKVTNTVIVDFSIDENTGVATIIYNNGTTKTVQLPLERINATFQTGMMTVLDFTAASWTESDGEYMLAFGSSQTGQDNKNFIVQICKKSAATYKVDTETVESEKNGEQTLSDTVFKGSDGSILLTASEAYIGTLYVLKDAIAKDDSAITKNIKDGTGNKALNQVQDGTNGTFDFTDKNPHATESDPTLTGEIPYGGTGAFSAAFGGKSAAQGKRSFAAGTTTIAKGNYSAAFGDNSVALGNDSFAEGYETVAEGQGSHSEGNKTQAKGMGSHAQGGNTVAEGDFSSAEGSNTKASGESSHVEGSEVEVQTVASHGEGYSNKIKNAMPSSEESGGSSAGTPDDPTWNIAEHLGEFSHIEGLNNLEYGYASHLQGFKNKAYAHISHVEGQGNTAGELGSTDDYYLHLEGKNNKATGEQNHIEGSDNTANGNNIHIEGTGNTAQGSDIHVEGKNNKVIGSNAHVGGENCEVTDGQTFAHGYGLKVGNYWQSAFGFYNENKFENAFEVGCGESDTKRKNAFAALKDGRAKVNTAPQEDDDVVRKLELDNATKEPHYELIEKVIIGYSLLTAEPEDFAENYANYYKTNGKARNDKDFAYVALTEAEPFEAGKYYYKDTAGSNFSRQTEPDGTPYKFSKMTLLFRTEDDKKLNAWTSTYFDMKDENFQDLQSLQPGIYSTGCLYVGGPNAGWKTAFGTFVTDGNSAVTFGAGLTEEGYSYKENTITNTQVFDKKPICWRLRAGAGIFPVGTTIYIYGVRK